MLPVIVGWIFLVQFVGVLIFKLPGNNFLPWEKSKEFEMAVATLSDFKYALWEGVFGYGWGLFLATQASSYLSHFYLGKPHPVYSAKDIAVRLLVWTIVGFVVGYYRRKGFSGDLLEDSGKNTSSATAPLPSHNK